MLKGGYSENKIFREAMESAVAYYRGLIRLGKAQGDIAAELDDELAAEVFWLVLSQMGQRIIRRLEAQYGTDWQGEKAAFDFPETQQLYAQLLRILEFGMGTHPYSLGETRGPNRVVSHSDQGA
jgi:hypothetical protein